MMMRNTLVLILLAVACDDQREPAEQPTPAPPVPPTAPPAPADPPVPAAPPLLPPGQTRLILTPKPGVLEIHYEGWLPCDGRYRLESKRTGHRIEVHATDTNSSLERVSCVGRTELDTVVRELPPGEYRVTFHPGPHRGTVEETATVP